MRLRTACLTLIALLVAASRLAAEDEGGGMVIGGPLGGSILPPAD